MIMNQPSCFERLHKLQQFWPSASTTARSLTCKRKTCTVASWLFQLPWLNSLTDEREETLTKANSHNPHRLSILGKMQAALTPPPHHHPGHSAAELRMWSTIKKIKKTLFIPAVSLCIWLSEKYHTPVWMRQGVFPSFIRAEIQMYGDDNCVWKGWDNKVEPLCWRFYHRTAASVTA